MAKTLDNIGARAGSGMVWLAGQTVLSRIIGLAAQWVLANWLLEESDFGQISLVYGITALTVAITDPGVNAVLLQKQRHFSRWASPAFWMSLALGIAGAAIMIAAGAGVVSTARLVGNQAYANANLFWMILILATAAPVTALGMVPMVHLQAEMRFARVTAVSTGELLLQQILLLTFAGMGFGAYSFVLPTPIVAAVKAAALWIIAPVKLRAELGIRRWPALTASTGWVFGQRLLNTATSVGDYHALAVLFGSNVLLGQYYFAYNLSTQVIRVLCDNTTAVLMPALSAMHPDRPRMLGAARRASRALAAMVIPLAGLQILLAGPAIRLIYVAKWEPTIVLLQWLSIGPLLLAPAWPFGALVNSSGRFRAGFFSWVFNVLTFFGLVVPLTLRWSAVGTSLAVGLWSWLMGMSFAVTALGSWRGIIEVIDSGIRPIVAMTVAAIPSALIVWLMPHGRVFEAITILLVGIITAAIYLPLLHRLDRPTMQALMERFGGMARPLTRLVWRRREVSHNIGGA